MPEGCTPIERSTHAALAQAATAGADTRVVPQPAARFVQKHAKAIDVMIEHIMVGFSAAGDNVFTAAIELCKQVAMTSAPFGCISHGKREVECEKESSNERGREVERDIQTDGQAGGQTDWLTD